MEIIDELKNYFFAVDQKDLIFSLLDATIFLLFAIAVLYLLIFAMKSVGKSKLEYPKAKKKYKFLVVFTAYKEDRVIVNSVDRFFEQDYDREKYDVLVVSEKMEQSTDKSLTMLGAKVINPNLKFSTKVGSFQSAIAYVDDNNYQYDYIVILNADNLVDKDFLQKLNNAFYSGCSAIQTHRIAKDCNTSVAILDAVSEEINNSIFRKGHTKMGLSSGLIGSGMAFEYPLFKKFITKTEHPGIDKQLEIYLLKNNYYIEYLNDVYTYDEKVSKSSQFYEQRKHWISTQFSNLFRGMWDCPKAALEGNWDYCNKLAQWTMPPRVILLGFISLISIVLTFMGSFLAIKWWVLLMLLILVFALSIPDYLFNKNLVKAVFSIPLLFFLMFINTLSIFRKSKKNGSPDRLE